MVKFMDRKDRERDSVIPINDNDCINANDESAKKPRKDSSRQSVTSTTDMESSTDMMNTSTGRSVSRMRRPTYREISNEVRRISNFSTLPTRCPRTTACIGGIIVPMWFLIALSMVGGYFTAKFEAPYEYDVNDSILAARATLGRNSRFQTTDKLLALPQNCLVDFLEETTASKGNITLFDFIYNGSISTEGETELTISEDDFEWRSIIIDLKDHLSKCRGIESVVLESLQTVREDSSTSLLFEDLTFNWIRCWDLEDSDHVALLPTDIRVEAASNQSDFYAATWMQDQQRLEKEYLNALPASSSVDEVIDARDRSVQDATGRGQCHPNTVATTWFFFTIMTTTGYGNQAPATSGGRALSVTFGFFSILAFGAVAAVASSILLVVFSDLMERLNIRVLNRPGPAALFWVGVATAWTFFFGNMSYNWWLGRLSPEEQPYASWWEAAWFAYMSTTTVGLGDYYLQPEYIFITDVFAFAFMLLICFVFFAILLNQLSACASGVFPDAVKDLKRRVKSTNLTNRERNEVRPSIGMGDQGETLVVALLKSLAAEEDAIEDGGRTSSTRTLAVIEREEELLKQVMEKCARERRKRTGERFL